MKTTFKKAATELTAKEILSIPLTEPEWIFPQDKDGITSLRRELAKKWHPDINKDPQASDAFQHASALSKSAEEKLESGSWHEPGKMQIHLSNGKTLKVNYLKRHDFELGEFYIGKNSVTYVVRGSYSDLYNNAVRTIEGLKFANDKMKKGFATYLPKILKKATARNGNQILIVERDPNMILMRDYLDHAKGKTDPKHVAWMMSRLHNMTAYLEWSGLTHNGMTLDTCFILPKDHSFKRTKKKRIAPKDHSVGVLGGWWYAAPIGGEKFWLPGKTREYVRRAAP